MAINKKIAVPLSIVAVALVAGSWLYKSGKIKAPGWYKGDGAASQQVTAKPLYTCPMHPFIIKDTPGSCPICGMQLIKKITDAQTATAQTPEQKQQAAQLGGVSLSPTQQVMANVETVTVQRMPLAKQVAATGIVQYDQSRQAKVTAWVAGRIDRLYVDTVGSYVSKGRPVAEIYSPDLVAAQQEYLLALKSREQLKNSTIQAISQGGEGLVASARQRLKLLGVKDAQIASLERAGEPNIKLPIYTPLSGVVIEKIVQQGQYVNMGDPLFAIADLSSVWVDVEVYENEFPFVKLRQPVAITSQSYPGKTFTGRVSFIYPFLDPKTRTVKVRVEMANPGLQLKPDMYVNAVIKSPVAAGLVVPASAVIDTGTRQVVWLEKQPGMFEPRDVKVGARVDDKVQILSGLSGGEKVAATGGYLLDSESQLRGGGNGSMPGMKMDDMKGMPMDQKKAPAPAPAAPKKDGPLDMTDMKM
jgi:membrane fusion protein, copper/silver efflux system